jgi:hypothetical protein
MRLAYALAFLAGCGGDAFQYSPVSSALEGPEAAAATATEESDAGHLGDGGPSPDSRGVEVAVPDEAGVEADVLEASESDHPVTTIAEAMAPEGAPDVAVKPTVEAGDEPPPLPMCTISCSHNAQCQAACANGALWCCQPFVAGAGGACYVAQTSTCPGS